MRGVGVAVGALLLAGTFVFATPRRVYVLTWAHAADTTPECRAVSEQFDRQLREELRRRGATVIDRQDARTAAIILRPNLELLPQGLKLNVLAVRSGDRKILGNISVKAGGSTREAQLRAIVQHACSEANEL